MAHAHYPDGRVSVTSGHGPSLEKEKKGVWRRRKCAEEVCRRSLVLLARVNTEDIIVDLASVGKA